MILSWLDRVSQVAAQRAEQARRMTLAGLGRPVDPLIWPILDRFHALGIPTRGSCEGHWIPDAHRPLNPFVTVRSGPDPALRRRWLAVVESFLAPPALPQILFSVDIRGFWVQWLQRPSDFSREQSRVLTTWSDRLDTAGRSLLASEPDDWSVWTMPDVGVPDAVDPMRLGLSFIEFLAQYDQPWDYLVRERLSGRDWTPIAQEVRLPETACRAAWDRVWRD